MMGAEKHPKPGSRAPCSRSAGPARSTPAPARLLALAALLGAVVLATPAIVRADEQARPQQEAGSQSKAEKKAKAQALVRAASELYLARKYAEALPLFRQAYELYPSPKIVMNTGSTLARLGRHAEAANTYQMFLRLADRDRSKDNEVQVILARQLAPRLGRLAISIRMAGKKPAGPESGPGPGPEPEIEIYIDGQKLEPFFRGPSRGSHDGLRAGPHDGEPVWVEPGVRSVRAEGPGVRAGEVEATAVAGQVTRVELVARPIARPGSPSRLQGSVQGSAAGNTSSDQAAGLPPGAAELDSGPTGRPGRGYRIAAWTGAAATVAGLAVAVIAHGRVAGAESDLQDAIGAYQFLTGDQLDVGDACSDAETRVPTPLTGVLLDDILDACDKGESAARLANVAYTATAVVTVLSVYFFYKGYMAAPRSEPATRTVQLTPTVGPEGIGAELTLRF